MNRPRTVATTNSTTDSPSPTSATTLTQRRGTRRARSGCMTCKIRKIKCDETRPYCLRCLRTGRECDGYLAGAQPSAALSRAVIQTHPDFESQAEARAFDFYLKRSSAALSGDMDTELWSRMVIQLSIKEPAVKHAALAISSLHRRADLTHRREQATGQHLDMDERFALTQYGKAMKALRLWKPAGGSDAATVPLILCLLFVAVEFLRGDQESSQLHICQGRNMLAGLREQDLSPHTFDLLKRYLVPMYRRLGLACYLFATVPAPIPSHFRNGSSSASVTAEGTEKDQLSAFTSIEQARDEFYNMLDEVLQFVNVAQYAAYSATPPDHEPKDLEAEIPRLIEHQRDLLARLEQWNVAFATLCVTLPPMALPTTTMQLLRIYYHAAKTWIATALMPSELSFDEHLQSFSAIVTSSVVVIDAMGRQQQDKHAAPAPENAFSFETEVIAPLYWTCTKCRHPALRRAALKLLQRDEMKTRKENLWSAEAMVCVSAYLISLEEGGQEEEEAEGAESLGVPQEENEGVFASAFSPADGSVDEAGMITVTMPSAVESLIDRLLRVPTWYPPTIPGHPNLKLLTTLSERSTPAPSLHSPPSEDPLTPGAVLDSELSELVQDSIKASYLLSQTPSPSPGPPSPMATSTRSRMGTPATNATMMSEGIPRTRPRPNPLAPSFGIPESMRVKNIIVGPYKDDGVWVTTFRDPRPGKEEWDVKRKFIVLRSGSDDVL